MCISLWPLPLEGAAHKMFNVFPSMVCKPSFASFLPRKFLLDFGLVSAWGSGGPVPTPPDSEMQLAKLRSRKIENKDCQNELHNELFADGYMIGMYWKTLLGVFPKELTETLGN